MNSETEISAPLRIVQLFAANFRNLARIEFSPGERFNIIYGDNGEGKSNLLELIDFLGTLKSFRGARAEELVRQNQDLSEFSARITSDTHTRIHRIRLPRNGARQVMVDDKKSRSRHEYMKAIQTVLFHPGTMQLVSGPAHLRREYIDRILEQFDATYASTLSAYNRALKSRNRLLGDDNPDRSAIAAYDELLASAGAIIGQARASLIQQMATGVQKVFDEFGSTKGRLAISYRPRVDPTVPSIRQALQRALAKDLKRGFTAEGPHADELLLQFRSTPARHYASQGQHRAIVLSLKIAELLELEKRVGRVPILLLDDVSSELDRATNSRLFAVLGQIGGQVFLTTTQPELILIKSDRSDFLIRNGSIIVPR